MDALWWNKESKNSISYFSSCSKYQKNLEEIQKETLSELPGYRLLQTKKEKDVLYSVVEVLGEDYKTINAMHIFRKGNCFYILNFVASSKESFQKEEPLFKKFTHQFQAQ